MKQTALLASTIYVGQAQGEEEKHIKRGAKVRPEDLSSPHDFGVCMPSGRVFLYFLSKTELWHRAVTLVRLRGWTAGLSLQIFAAMRQN